MKIEYDEAMEEFLKINYPNKKISVLQKSFGAVGIVEDKYIYYCGGVGYSKENHNKTNAHIEALREDDLLKDTFVSVNDTWGYTLKYNPAREKEIINNYPEIKNGMGNIDYYFFCVKGYFNKKEYSKIFAINELSEIEDCLSEFYKCEYIMCCKYNKRTVVNLQRELRKLSIEMGDTESGLSYRLETCYIRKEKNKNEKKLLDKIRRLFPMTNVYYDEDAPIPIYIPSLNLLIDMPRKPSDFKVIDRLKIYNDYINDINNIARRQYINDKKATVITFENDNDLTLYAIANSFNSLIDNNVVIENNHNYKYDLYNQLYLKYHYFGHPDCIVAYVNFGSSRKEYAYLANKKYKKGDKVRLLSPSGYNDVTVVRCKEYKSIDKMPYPYDKIKCLD